MLLVGLGEVSAQYKITRKSTTTQTNKKPKAKTTHNSKARKSQVPIRAIFNLWAIPINNRYLNVKELFPDLKNIENIREVIVKSSNCDVEDMNITMRFDDRGNLIFKEKPYCFSLGGERVTYKYDINNKLISVKLIYQSEYQDGPIPLISANYNYTWKEGRVIEIEETLEVDEGINYKGKPTHMKFIYDSKGRLHKAVCQEDSKIFFTFDYGDNSATMRTYSLLYNIEDWSNIKPSDMKKGNGFTEYFAKKLPLKWIYGPTTFDYTINSPWKEEVEDFTPPSNASFTFDKFGNWTKARWNGPCNFEDYGENTTTRIITYK